MPLPEILNTLQLHKIMMGDRCVRRLFRGVCARDQLPTRLQFPSCLIVNTHSSREPGEHWLAVYYDINGLCEFFDSYGRPPSAYRLYSYLKSTSRRVTWNRTCFQPIDSNACGYYCFLYLMFKCRGLNFDVDKTELDSFLSSLFQ